MNKNYNRVCIYARVSTNDQSVEGQLLELREYCKARDWKIEHELFDHGYTGTNDRRPSLKQLMTLARGRKIDVIVIQKLDRLFRSLKDLVVTIKEFSDLGISLVALKDQIDLTTAAGRLMIVVIGAFAEFEADLIKERVNAGIALARKKGKTLGRPMRNNYDEIRKLKEEGLTYTQIQDRLKCSKGAVCRALSSTPKSLKNIDQIEQLKTSG